MVSDRFHVSALLPLLTGDGRFFVLALSENEARLLAGTRFNVHVVNVPGLPAGVKDALRYDDPQRELGSHAAERGGPGARVVLHGQGIGAEVQKERLGRYLQAVDGAVRRSLREQQAPLVLAGVEYVRAMYRDVNTYPHLLEAGISGSPGSDVNRRAPYPRMGVGGAPLRARQGRCSGRLPRSSRHRTCV